MSKLKCPECGSDNITETPYPKNWGGKEYTCDDCGHVFEQPFDEERTHGEDYE